jgi:predicted MFS family arabinose efflux permease
MSSSPVAVLRQPYTARVLAATIIGRLPAGMAPLAILLLARSQGGSYALAGLLLSVYSMGAAVSGPALGRAVDWLGQQRILVPSAVVSAFAFAVLSITGAEPIALSCGMAILAGLANPPLEPCLRALLPRLMRGGPPVESAYALEIATQELVYVLGPVIVVALAGGVDERVAVSACGAFALIGTGAFATATPSRQWRASHSVSRGWGPLGSPAVRLLAITALQIGVTIGLTTVATTAFAEEHGSREAAGWLLAIWPAGALVGGLWYSTLTPADAPGRRLRWLLAFYALSFLPAILAPSIAVLAAILGIGGASLAPLLSGIFVLVSRATPDTAVTESFAWLVSGFVVGSALGSACAGALVDGYTVGAAFGSAAFVGAAALALWIGASR